ncbi:hepatitis A virus cellular receptor 1 homolog [Rhinolophus ferrumequinum]|uniref:hepatitis A virus cellular receptor 1 homolog n=1 Tax=Rhinolophus ferrumequinum TaxID=59479 RepID=UPI00140FBBEB|nr:hepatitis A virus cellular receptor 1 homolog [Rhinolophus ferrumequinum]
MRPWEAITGLILLWTDAVVSQVRVSGVVGQSVTLPCTYSTAGGVTAMCWGRGPCPWYLCSNQLIKTDGHRVIFQRNKRYELNGPISKGNVSLTIKNATQADSGIYCCRVELSGWFNDLKVNILLEMKPAPPKVTRVPTSHRVSTSAPTTPAYTQKRKTAPPKVTSVQTSLQVSTSMPTTPASTQKRKTAPPKVTRVPTSHQVSTSAPTMPASTPNLKTDTTSSSPMQTAETQLITPQETNTSSLPVNPCLTDGNGTVAEPSDGVWEYNETHMCLEEKERMTTNEALYIGISIPIVLLLAILTAIITKKYLCTRRKVLQIRKVLFNDPKNGTLENPAAVRYQADENIYIENNLYNVHSDSVAH